MTIPGTSSASTPTDGTTPDVVAELAATIAAACDRIAPTWPLDRFIAVNPYWGWRTSPIDEAAARLGVVAGTTLTMPRHWFRDEWRAGRLAPHHLDATARELGRPDLATVARTVLDATGEPRQHPLQRLALVTDLRDDGAGPVPGRTWTDLVVHQTSQHCASHVDHWQATWAPETAEGLFSSWRCDPSVTHGFAWRNGPKWARDRIDALPISTARAVAMMLDGLAIEPDAREAYLTALLASVNGWAAWCAYLRWQARLLGDDDDTIVDLLAIRLAWEWLLAEDMRDGADGTSRLDEWAWSWSLVDTVAAETADEQRLDWVLQDALERTFQDRVVAGALQASPADGPVDVQAVFCIDVRSEVFRRALESTSPAMRTRGFAGFFGLPIAFTPAGSALTRPQLPGLLAPALHVTETANDDADADGVAARSGVLQERRRWQAFRKDPSSVFSFVEAMGLPYAAKLVKESLPHRHAPEPWEHDGLGPVRHGLRPRLESVDGDPAAAAAIAHRVLSGMGLSDDIAPLVLLCGHGSHSANNAHAAGLDCGACGGQTGEVNARVLADLLNDPAVRRELSALGRQLPDTTWFLAGLHDTTTDTVEVFDADLVPASHRQRVAQLTDQLRAAGDRARAERAESLGLGNLIHTSELLERRVRERANDWSQVRPEWGLAGNAAFVVAPRSRTRHLDLQGRCFLHDYDWRLDTDLSVLTLIMTAPMVVTNWINMQYHASTVDHRRYGCGDKVLHNVVGGHLGVFEGNGGDLRIGLSMQSLHDGTTLRHPPLRLSVFIEAPRSSLDTVIAEQPVVEHLVSGRWLHLLRIDPSDGSTERWTHDGWQPCQVPAATDS